MLRVTGLCVGKSPHKGTVTRKKIPFDDVIMNLYIRFEINLRWTPQNHNNVNWTLIQVIPWCRQPTSHYRAKVDPELCHHDVDAPRMVDVVSYCCLRLCNFCILAWLTSNGVLWNVCSDAYLVMSGHFKGSFICFWPYIINSYVLSWQMRAIVPSAISRNVFAIDYANRTVISWRKSYWDVNFQW